MLEVLLFFMFAVIIGLMFAFFGYPFFRILLPVWGFFAGLMFGFRGIESLLGAGFLTASLGLIIGFFLGLLLAAVAYFAYAVAVYLWGISLGYVLGAGLMLALGFDSGMMTFLVGAASAVAFAFLFSMAKMPKFIIILFTAAGGSMAVIMGVFALFGKVPTMAASLELTRYMVYGSWFWLILWAVLAGFGMAFQYATVSMTEDVTEVYDWDKEYTEMATATPKKK
jgi:hypothetical protein